MVGAELDWQPADDVELVVDQHFQIEEVGPLELFHVEQKARRSRDAAKLDHIDAPNQSFGQIPQAHAVQRLVGELVAKIDAVDTAAKALHCHRTLAQRVVERLLDQAGLIGTGPAATPFLHRLSPHQQLARAGVRGCSTCCLEHGRRHLAQVHPGQSAGKAQIQGQGPGGKCAGGALRCRLGAHLDVVLAKPLVEGGLHTVGVGVGIPGKLQHFAVALGQQARSAWHRRVAQGVGAAHRIGALEEAQALVLVFGLVQFQQLDGPGLGKSHPLGLTARLAQQRLLDILGLGQIHGQFETRRFLATELHLAGVWQQHQFLDGRDTRHTHGRFGVGRLLLDQVDEALDLRGDGRQAGQLIPVAGVAVVDLVQLQVPRRATHVAVNRPGLATGLMVVSHPHLVAELDPL